MMSSTGRQSTPPQHPNHLVVDPLVKRSIIQACRFGPAYLATVRCLGTPRFRNPMAQDLGCLLDVDPSVEAWECLPFGVTLEDPTGKQRRHVPDFLVSRTDGSTVLVDAIPVPESENSIAGFCTTGRAEQGYEQILETQIRGGPRLSNAKELLRYAGVRISLSERIHFMAMLDERGPVAISECLRGCRSATDPIALIAVLTLRRLIDMDLDQAPIGPETVIRRLHD